MKHPASLDAASIGTAAGDASRQLTIETVTEIDSTNAELMRRPFALAQGCALLADSQSAGRGRRGKSWHSPMSSNLYLSLGWRLARDVVEWPTLPLVAGIATAEALATIGLTGHGLKWPNDLVVDDRKLGGILVESRRSGSDALAVIGLGLNVHMRPADGADIDQPWAALEGLVAAPDRSRVAGRILSAWVQALNRWNCEGFSGFSDAWAHWDVLAGKTVSVTGNPVPLAGRVTGLMPDGRLRVMTESGPVDCLAGEVSIRVQ